ncbi:SCP2 sterol-binding domain-containing protein [Streptomyces sp. 4N509B]|uniref:SCP2 sterol-binding domain-containing protein n=1 Tax=Streptomyces sp. 4N509B TaxID=3457413 RepID=UPI003FD50752
MTQSPAGSASAFHELRSSIEGRSEADIHAYVREREGGAGALLDLVFGEMPGAFLPERAGGRELSFQYEIVADGGPWFYFADVRGGACHCGRGTLPDPSVTMTMEIPVFLQVLTGTMAPVRAFLTRRIRVSGDMMAATKFESWFARP